MANQPHAMRRHCSSGWYKRMRESILNGSVFCVRCGVRFAEELDHVVPLRLGGSHHPSNLQGLCIPCHRNKTASENRSHPPRRKAKLRYEEYING